MRGITLAIALVAWGCGGSDETSSGCPARECSTTDASIGDTSTADTRVDAPTGNACQEAGGQCGCAGGCPTGSRHGNSVEDNACPQPCPTCGACSQWCCIPEPSDPGDAATDGG